MAGRPLVPGVTLGGLTPAVHGSRLSPLLGTCAGVASVAGVAGTVIAWQGQRNGPFQHSSFSVDDSEPANHSTPVTGHRTAGQEWPGGEQHVPSTATHLRKVPKVITDMCPRLVYLVASVSLRRRQSGPPRL